MLAKNLPLNGKGYAQNMRVIFTVFTIGILSSGCHRLPHRQAPTELGVNQIPIGYAGSQEYAFCSLNGGIFPCKKPTIKTKARVDLNSNSSANEQVSNNFSDYVAESAMVVYFDFDSDVLKADARKTIDQLIPSIKDKTIFLNGFTDAIGQKKYNDHLASKRSLAVQKYMVSKGFPSSKIITEGTGLCCYVVSNDTDEHRSKNRRVEIILADKK
jgi:outer membrane protein OmpA-like peptidoglycan-associated protein